MRLIEVKGRSDQTGEVEIEENQHRSVAMNSRVNVDRFLLIDTSGSP
ncbi:MAG TPA: hypothetical protein VGO40_23045 [Longimicrobium sp.]|nr:hypothetical protein [Longimicrobium sp.]